MSINFGLAEGPTNLFASAQNAFLAGQQQAQDRRTQNALATYGATPEKLPNALLEAGDLQGATQAQAYNSNADAQAAQHEQRAAQVAALQRQGQVREKLQAGDIQGAYQVAAGDPETMKLVDAVGKHAQETSAAIAQLGHGLKDIQDPAKRLAVFNSMKPGLLQQGYDQHTLDSFEPTNENIDAIIAQHTTLADQFARNKPVVVAPNASLVAPTGGPPIFTAPPPPAKPSEGYEFGPDGKTMQPIKGGPADPKVAHTLAQARHIPGAGGGGLASHGLGPSDSQILAQAVAENRINADRINSRTAPIFVAMLKAQPSLNAINNAGIAAMAKNAPMQSKALMADILPTVVENVRDAGKKVNFSNIRPLGSLQATIKANTNNPDFVYYMTQRNDAVQTLAQVMRGAGATDQSTKMESEAAHIALSPDAFDAWYRAQMKAIEPRLKSYDAFKVTPGGSVAHPAAGGERLTPEQAQALPPGTKFIGADGKERVRH